MKAKLGLIFLLTFFSNRIFSQDLVPNSSFEEFSQCPSDVLYQDQDSEINLAIGWHSYRTSPCYHNTCCQLNWLWCAPQNFAGYQVPATGNAYCGIYTYSSSNPNYREIFGCKLSSPLTIGQTYFVSFKVSTASKGIEINSYTNNLGVKFSTVEFETYNNPMPINNFAHINCGIIVKDTMNWLTVQGSFVADSSYQYIALGNFFDDAHTKFHSTQSSPPYLAYYYLDDVKLSTDEAESWTDTLFILSGASDPWIIYPNPASVELIVAASVPTQQIEIYNTIGQELLSVNTSSLPKTSSYNISIRYLPAGCYFIRMQGEGYKQTKKFIVTH